MWTTALLAAAIFGTVTGCSDRRQVPAYADTLALFSPEAPGYGADVSCTSELHDQPKAYCLYASAEARRFAATREPTALGNAMRAADWLVENADLDNDGVIGWGLPFAWDAGADGSLNSANTEYAIETAMGIQALLDVRDVLDPVAYRERRSAYIGTSLAAAQTYAAAHTIRVADGIVFRYSSENADSYHVLNVTAMIAGQLQRLSRCVPAREAEQLETLSDAAIAYIAARAVTTDGVPFWLYYGAELPASRQDNNLPNDMQHESYILQGILDYQLNEGHLGVLFSPHVLLANLQRFLTAKKVVLFPRGYEYPLNLANTLDRWPELWRIAYALHVAVRLEEALGLNAGAVSSTLAANLLDAYRGRNGDWLYSPDDPRPCSYPRQLAFVLLGLSSYEYRPLDVLVPDTRQVDATGARSIASQMPSASEENWHSTRPARGA